MVYEGNLLPENYQSAVIEAARPALVSSITSP